MGANCCNALLGENQENEYLNIDWDQLNTEKRYSGKNRGILTAKSGVSSNGLTTKIHHQILQIAENYEFLKYDEYFNKQLPDFTTKNYIDDKFPPNLNSLLYLNPANENSKDVTDEEKDTLKQFRWKRAHEILKNDFILYDKIEIEDIHQGLIGNCYFLSAVAATAEYEERFDKIFVTKKKSDNGCYAARFIIQGIPEIVVVDDYFPISDDYFAGATSGYKEIWVQLLEKAWAKINESYASTIAGLPGEALASLTEAPCVSYIHKRYPEDKLSELWNIIKTSDLRDYIICTNTGENSDAKSMGLVNSHAYTVIGVYEHEDLKLVKLRNPWGQFEWKGDFGDKSDKWNQYPGLKNQVGYSNKDDGIFYMTFHDFVKYYPYTFICKYEKGFHYKFRKLEQISNDHMTCGKIIIKNPVKIAIGLHQKQQRFYHKVIGYKPQMSRIILAKFNPLENYEYVLSDSNDKEKLYIEIENLEPGEYHIFCNVNWPYNVPCRYIVSTYAEYSVEIEKLERNSIPNDFLNQILISYIEMNCPKTKINSFSYYQDSIRDNDIGFYMVLFNNMSDNEHLKINFNCTYNDKCIFYSESSISNREKSVNNGMTNDSMSINLNPNTKQLLAWRLLGNPWLCKLQPTNMSCQTITEETTFEDAYKIIIDQHIKTLHKENLSLDFFYSELDLEDGVLIILENKSKVGYYKFKLNFQTLKNLEVVTNKLVFNVYSGTYYYIRLRKITNNKEYTYNFIYSFKKY